MSCLNSSSVLTFSLSTSSKRETEAASLVGGSGVVNRRYRWQAGQQKVDRRYRWQAGQ